MFDDWPKGRLRLAIGAAQIGQTYGMSQKGPPDLNEVKKLIRYASDMGHNLVDTAPSYGDSETLLGLSGFANDLKIVTKFVRLKKDFGVTKNERHLWHHFLQSKKKMGVEDLYGVLIHNPFDLEYEDGMFYKKFIHEFRKVNVNTKIGVSVYNEVDLERSLSLFAPDIVQMPINLFDQRLVKSGHLRRLAEMGVEIHARSVFLQGALTQKQSFLEKWSPSFAGLIKDASSQASLLGCSLAQLSLSFVNSLPEVSQVLVGCRSATQVRALIGVDVRDVPMSVAEKFCQDDVGFIDPRNW